MADENVKDGDKNCVGMKTVIWWKFYDWFGNAKIFGYPEDPPLPSLALEITTSVTKYENWQNSWLKYLNFGNGVTVNALYIGKMIRVNLS